MDFPAVYESLQTSGGTAPFAARVKEMRRQFEERTGSFGPDDPWFEVRSRAFWDDALTQHGFAAAVVPAVPEPLRALAQEWTRPLDRAHRGLFHPERDASGWRLIDQWSGAEFVVGMPDPGLHEALAAATLLDGRVVARLGPLGIPEIALLPGAVFHPEDATEPIARLLDASRHDGALSTGELLDALLRMERNLRSHARVKASYAYRVEGLRAPGSQSSVAVLTPKPGLRKPPKKS